MKQILLLLVLAVALGSASIVKADPTSATKQDGSSFINVTANLSASAPEPTYWYYLKPVAVTTQSTHYALFKDAVGGNFTLSWYFRCGIVKETKDVGTATPVLLPNASWSRITPLTNQDALSGGHYQAYATSTLNYNGTVGPYASDTRAVDVYPGNPPPGP